MRNSLKNTKKRKIFRKRRRKNAKNGKTTKYPPWKTKQKKKRFRDSINWSGDLKNFYLLQTYFLQMTNLLKHSKNKVSLEFGENPKGMICFATSRFWGHWKECVEVLKLFFQRMSLVLEFFGGFLKVVSCFQFFCCWLNFESQFTKTFDFYPD